MPPLRPNPAARKSPRSRLVISLAALLAFAGLAGLSPTASATGSTAPPLPVDLVGYVRHVGDGDTLDVEVAGSIQRVRLTGINAMELTTYSSNPERWRGECHAVEAARALRELTYNQLVRVVAQDAASMSGSRYRRSVLVLRDGQWRDVSELLLQAGHGLFLASGKEYLPNQQDAAAAQYAAFNRNGIFDTDACGLGPSQAAALKVRVNWDAPGDDSRNLNGEWVRIYNGSSYAVPVGGWWVRDSAYRGYLGRGYVLPKGTRVGARSSITLYVGEGSRDARRLYWGQSVPVFENATTAPTHVGDGAYLFDPQGDLRAWHQYPCQYGC